MVSQENGSVERKTYIHFCVVDFLAVRYNTLITNDYRFGIWWFQRNRSFVQIFSLCRDEIGSDLQCNSLAVYDCHG